ncbi:MAG: hypothetical protein Q9191_003718 [Dirinaria sp. TL-2023a]
MTSSLHPRGTHPPAFANSGVASHPSQFGPISARMAPNGSQQGQPPSQALASPPPSDAPRPNDNIMNRRGDLSSSLYQICLDLKARMARVPNFEIFIAEMEEEEAEAMESTDPVTSMWNCLRRGYPLMAIYNALLPKAPLNVDASRMAESKVGKAATFKFLQACLTDLKFPPSECFLITDLYGGDTTGFVKVTKVVNRVLGILESRGLLNESRARKGEKEVPQTLTYRQNLIREIVTTERDYVQHLEDLQQFKKDLEECGAIAGDALHDIFLNLNALLDFQRRFLIRIEQQNHLPEIQQNWGQLFIQYKDSFRVYEPFIANQVRCNHAVVREWDKIKAAPISSNVRGMELRKKGGLDDDRKYDLVQGSAAATSILFRANEAIHKEQRLAAVCELQSRVEDWKNHQIEHFGELLLFGDYTVVKGEGAKEVEREVCTIFDSLSPQGRQHVRLVSGQLAGSSPWSMNATQMRQRPLPHSSTQADYEGTGLPTPDSTLQDQSLPSPYGLRRFVSGLREVPEEDGDKADQQPRREATAETPTAVAQATAGLTGPSTKTAPAPRSKPSKAGLFQRYKLGKTASPSTPLGFSTAAASPASIDIPVAQPSSREGLGSEGGSIPPTPSRKSKFVGSPGLLSNFGQKVKTQGRKVKAVLQKPRNAPVDPSLYAHLYNFNGCLTRETVFHTFQSPSDPASGPWPRASNMSVQERTKSSLQTTGSTPITSIESKTCEELKLISPVRIQYKVYLFERILLCCKEINPNKPKNKMIGNNKSLVDKKGKPRLQLKGRIFMQNVTDVLTVAKSEKQDYKIQIFWKGDPGVENFVIRFLNEGDMNTWRDQVQIQKKALSESARSSGQTGTSETEFLAMKDQLSSLKNPHLDDDADEGHGNTSSGVPGSSNFGMTRQASSNSLVSAGTTLNGSVRGAPPRFPMPEPAAYQPPLSLKTNIPPAASSPGEFGGNSYFSPGGDSPMSTRSSSQASMFALPRQMTPRLSNEDGKHKTAPAMARVPSREGTRPINGYTLDGRTVLRPSLPVMAGPANAQQQNRLRSASTPDIQSNAGAPRRYANGQLQPPVDNVPVPPIPSHMTQMRAPIARSQTSSPTNGTLPTRNNAHSPMHPRDRTPRPNPDPSNNYDQQMQQRLQAIPNTEPRRYQEGSYADASLQMMTTSATPAPLPASSSGVPYPTQLKIKVTYGEKAGHITIVVPIIIKHRSLIDRIDSKMKHVSDAKVAEDRARLRYTDEDGDYVTIKTDDDVQIAIDDWVIRNEEQLKKGIVPDFDLFWHEVRNNN